MHHVHILVSLLSVYALYCAGKAVINKCFTDYGDEDMVRACVNKYNGNRELMDPSLGGVKTLGNTLSMYHQPAQEWQVSLFLYLCALFPERLLGFGSIRQSPKGARILCSDRIPNFKTCCCL
jgi:hypothetical protein